MSVALSPSSQHPVPAGPNPPRATRPEGTTPMARPDAPPPSPRESVPRQDGGPSEPIVNPVLRIDAAANVVVMEWWQGAEVARQIPTERELEAYQDGTATPCSFPRAAPAPAEAASRTDAVASARLDVVI